MNAGRMLSRIVISTCLLPAALHAQSCDRLSKLISPTVSITLTLTKVVDTGTFTPTGSTSTFLYLPAFCRVAASLKPTSDSDIRIEVWLPESGWNGKLESAGNGGWAGTISYPAMATALAAGYAAASTD